MPNPTHIQGVALSSLAEQFGTPLYIYDGAKIVSQVKTLQEAFASVPLKIKYATKALSNINVLKLIRKAGVVIPSEPNEYGMKLCSLQTTEGGQ